MQIIHLEHEMDTYIKNVYNYMEAKKVLIHLSIVILCCVTLYRFSFGLCLNPRLVDGILV